MVVDVETSVVSPPAAYWRRREEVAASAGGPDAEPRDIDYLDVEHDTWRAVSAALEPAWARHAAADVLRARDLLGLPADRVPQLRRVDARLRELTGFGYRAVAGLVPPGEFFAALGTRRFLSTQYVRWHGAPLYTPEPDVIHEVIGHANCLACPELAELHRLAGDAIVRVTRPESVQVIADVFWFTAEFGVVRECGEWKAYGAGLLSSPGELGWFADHSDVRPLDVAAMAVLPYDISRYQPILFGASSLTEVLEEVGGFFATATDRSIAALR